MNEQLILNVVIERNGKPISCKIEMPYLVAKKEMNFASLICDISFFPEKYRISSGYAKKVLNEIYDNELTDEECANILNSYRGIGIMSGEFCKQFDNIAALFVNHCLSMCLIDKDGKLLPNTFTPKVDQAMYKMLENNTLLHEIYQYRVENNKCIKVGKINLTTMKPNVV